MFEPVPHRNSPEAFGRVGTACCAFALRVDRLIRLAWKYRRVIRLMRAQNKDLRRQLHEAWGLKESKGRSHGNVES